MRFEYSQAIVLSPDTGEPMAMFRPEIPLLMSGAEDRREFLALVDTGADHIVAPGWIAETLNVETHSCTGPSPIGYTGATFNVHYGDVELTLVQGDVSLSWQARVYFAPASSSDATIILGHAGFLEFFTARFVGSEFALELEPNEHLPRIREGVS